MLSESTKEKLFLFLESEKLNSFDANYFRSLYALKDDNSLDAQVLKSRDKRSGFEGRTLLHNAVRSGNYSAAVYFINAGAEVNIIDSCNSKITPLMDAITWNYLQLAVSLIQGGSDLFLQDIRGENILHYCARNGSTRMLTTIIKSCNLSSKELKLLASMPNLKLKFPEDICRGCRIKEMLTQLREKGCIQ